MHRLGVCAEVVDRKRRKKSRWNISGFRFCEKRQETPPSATFLDKKPEKYHSKYLGASYIKPVGEPEKEIGMNAVRGYGMEKYELIKRLLTPVVFAQKSIARANGTQKEQDRIIALNAQKVVPGGILLYGPPGTGKTYIAEKIGEHLQRFDVNFINLKLLNTTDKNIEMFNEAVKNAEEYKNRTGKYTVILLNDLNYSYNRGTKEFDMLLENLDKAKQNHIIFILTANKASDIDKAFLRKGRLDIKMPIGNMETFEKADMINYALLSYPETKKKAKDFDFLLFLVICPAVWHLKIGDLGVSPGGCSCVWQVGGVSLAGLAVHSGFAGRGLWHLAGIQVLIISGKALA